MGFKVISEKYVVNKKLNVGVVYQIRNGQVIIDLKHLTDKVLDEEGIGKYKIDKMTINIPFDVNKQVTGNLISMIINKARYLIRLKALEILPSKQQKIDYDNTHPHRWKTPQWIKFIEERFYETYGVKAMELDLRGPQGSSKRGKVYGNMKSLLTKFNDNDMDSINLINYIKWAFNKKSKSYISLGILQSDTMIQEWTVFKNRTKIKKKVKRKWDQ